MGGLEDGSRPSGEAASVAAAAEVLRAGGVVVFPTETFYALGADPRSSEGVEAVFGRKGRPRDRPLPWIAADCAQVEAVCRLPPPAAALAGRYWPGPLTLVLPLRGTPGTAAVRVSSHPAARALAAALGYPVISTSANRSGEPPASTASEAAAVLRGGGSERTLVLDGGPTPGGAPSVILDATTSDLRPLRGSLEQIPEAAGLPDRAPGRRKAD